MPRKARPLSYYLLGFAAAILVPLVAFGWFITLFLASAERQRVERQAQELAKQVGQILDSEVRVLSSLLVGLASSSALFSDDLPRFHSEAKRAAGGNDRVVVLRAFDTTQFLNTQVPFGETLPPAVSIAEAERQAFERGEPVVSDVYKSPLSGEPRIAVATLVQTASGRRILAITVPTTLVRDALLKAVPSGWLIGVADAKGNYVTRSERHEDVSGKKGSAEYLEKATGKQGVFTATTLDAVAVIAGYFRPELSNWLVVANIDRRAANVLTLRSMTAVLAAGILATLLSIALSLYLSRKFSAVATTFGEHARLLGETRRFDAPPSRIGELEAIRRALSDASTQLLEHEDQNRLLINELNHRVKNTLATVQSLARQSLKGTQNAEALTGRLMALARAHDLIAQSNWSGVSLDGTVRQVTEPYRDHFEISGPNVHLSPAVASSLALVFHELCTNAAKYGALSVAEGRVHLTWGQKEGFSHLVEVTWREQGGPSVAPPSKLGFGSTLIQKSFSTGELSTSLDFHAAGLRCTIVVPALLDATREEP